MPQTPSILLELMPGLGKIRARADAAFNQVSAQFPQAVSCKPQCDDCCHALFDLSPIESLALAMAFAELPRGKRRDIERRAKKAAKTFDRVLDKALALQGEVRLAVLSQARIPCPLLEDKRCVLYEHRPVTCRLYGIPVAIEGQPRTCHLAGFQTGQTYPTVDMAKLQQELEALSVRLLGQLPALPRQRLDVARSLELAGRLKELLSSGQ